MCYTQHSRKNTCKGTQMYYVQSINYNILHILLCEISNTKKRIQTNLFVE